MRYRADGERQRVRDLFSCPGGTVDQLAVLRGGAAHGGGQCSLRGPVVPIDDGLHQRVLVQEGSALEQLAYELRGDRKSTRLNSSHVAISYAVFCLKKKKQIRHH